MPDPQVLYVVTALVVVGLAIWVAFVLATAKTPWARPSAEKKPETDRTSKPPADREKASQEEEKGEEKDDEPPSEPSPDATGQATPVVIADRPPHDEAKKDE